MTQVTQEEETRQMIRLWLNKVLFLSKWKWKVKLPSSRKNQQFFRAELCFKPTRTKWLVIRTNLYQLLLKSLEHQQ